MRQSILKNRTTHVTEVIDKSTGEVLETNIKRHRYIANSNEEFFLTYSTLVGVFQKISMAEIRVYAFLLEHYNVKYKIVINDIIREDIAKKTNLSTGTVANALISLCSTDNTLHPLLYRIGRGTYQINPRFAFKGSTAQRNNSLKAIIELGCKNC